MSEWLPFNVVARAVAALSIALTGCSGLSGATTAGGRPLIYKQGPGDPPSSIEQKAGVVVKRDTLPEPGSNTPSDTSGAASTAPTDH